MTASLTCTGSLAWDGTLVGLGGFAPAGLITIARADGAPIANDNDSKPCRPGVLAAPGAVDIVHCRTWGIEGGSGAA